jgi:orotate phosphoribosyltransferase
MSDFRQEFLEFALARDVLRFGAFVTKAGRKTPYFFNAGLFNDGASLGELGRYYATAYLASELRCDQLYGPAYKGITLAAVTAVALAAGAGAGSRHPGRRDRDARRLAGAAGAAPGPGAAKARSDLVSRAIWRRRVRRRESPETGKGLL